MWFQGNEFGVFFSDTHSKGDKVTINCETRVRLSWLFCLMIYTKQRMEIKCKDKQHQERNSSVCARGKL